MMVKASKDRKTQKAIEMYVHWAIDILKKGLEFGLCSRWFYYKCKGTTEKRVLKNTHMRHTTSVKNTRNRSN